MCHINNYNQMFMKVIIISALITIVLAACNNKNPQNSIFNDEKVEMAVRASLNFKAEQKIQFKDLDSITEITLTRCHDLGGLRYLHNLRKLYIVSGIRNFSELSELKALETLCITGCRLSDIKFLSQLNKIEYLVLDKNRIKDISAIGLLTQLKELSLSHNNVKNASTLSKLVNVEYISVYNNSIEQLPDLSGCKNLREIDLQSNYIVYNSNFSKLKNVKNIWLGGNKIDKIDWITSLDSIKKINLCDNPINCDMVYKNKKLMKLIDKEILVLDCGTK
jgi:internalin A